MPQSISDNIEDRIFFFSEFIDPKILPLLINSEYSPLGKELLQRKQLCRIKQPIHLLSNPLILVIDVQQPQDFRLNRIVLLQ